MKTLILSQSETARLLPMSECIEVMEEAFRSLAAGRVAQPLRMVMSAGGSNVLGLMPSMVADQGALGAKIISVFPGNHGSALDAHQGVVILFDPERGRIDAIVDATAITGIRTAAASAAATRALANPDARSLAVLGAGVQARAHLEAMGIVRRLHLVRVWSPFPDEAARFAEAESRRTGIEVRPAGSAREAVEGMDLVCTVTPSKEPILAGSWLKPGAHVNAVGASQAGSRELDAEAVRRSRLYVDRRESALREAGDFLLAKAEGAVDDSHIRGELGEVLAGRAEGRVSPGDITLFKSVGLAMEDVAAAAHVFRKARRCGAGVEVEIGGARAAH